MTMEMSDEEATGQVPTEMRAVVQERYGWEDLTVVEVPVPEATGDQVLIEVRASSLNALDWHLVTGTPYLVRPTAGVRTPKRRTPGVDVAGVVVAVGPEVTSFAIGDDVFGWGEGGCAEYVVVPEGQLLAKPEAMTFEQAGALGVAGFTAIQGVRDHGGVAAGESVLVNGAAGGVGTFCVQIAKASGATVTAVCSGRNVEMVRALGADRVVNYETEDLAADGQRYNVMIDSVGNRSLGDCRRVLTDEGRYVMISGPKRKVLGPVPRMIRFAVRFMFGDQSFHQFVAKDNLEDLGALRDLFVEGSLRPEIEKTVGLDEVRSALEYLGTGHARAKIVVVP